MLQVVQIVWCCVCTVYKHDIAYVHIIYLCIYVCMYVYDKGRTYCMYVCVYICMPEM